MWNSWKILHTVWKVSKYRVFSDPNTGKYGPEETPYLDTFHTETIKAGILQLENMRVEPGSCELQLAVYYSKSCETIILWANEFVVYSQCELPANKLASCKSTVLWVASVQMKSLTYLQINLSRSWRIWQLFSEFIILRFYVSSCLCLIFTLQLPYVKSEAARNAM